MQILGCLMPILNPPLRKNTVEAFVSIHIPTYNEPPQLVKNTLRALSQLDYKNYEVIVIDNNTKKGATWKPVRKYCYKLGSRFKFCHIDHLAGFKAGALNYIQDKVNPKTEFTAVIDADYEVRPSFLKEALRYFTNDKIALVQFPQAYKNINRQNLGISMEYEHFFHLYMNMANHFHCATSTGTLAIYRISSLKQVNLFSEKCVTEDADMGVRLLRAGFETIYVPKVIGRGLMPFDIEAYKKQKARWSLGNAQILKNQLIQILFDKQLSLGQKIGLISHLTAWINFTLMPALILLLGAFIKIVVPVNHAAILLSLEIAAVTLYLFFFIKLLTFIFSFRRRYPIRDVLRGFLVHLGMGLEYSTVFMSVAFKKQTIFERTNKFILPRMPNLMKNTFKEISLGIVSLVLGVALLVVKNDFFHASALFLIGTIYLLVFFVYFEIKQTKLLSGQLIDKMETSFYGY